jgi:hypothetical protein
VNEAVANVLGVACVNRPSTAGDGASSIQFAVYTLQGLRRQENFGLFLEKVVSLAAHDPSTRCIAAAEIIGGNAKE